MRVTNNKNLQRLFIWLAVFSVLLASLAPTVSRIVFSQTASPGWVEVCTVEGLQRLSSVLFEDAQSPSDNPGSRFGSHFEYCPFCTTHACSFGLVPVAEAALPPLTTVYFPPDALSVRYARFVWQPGQARAPPVFL